MAKQIFSNIDFSGNAALNMVIGSRDSDPANVAHGYLYYNTVRGCLRVLCGDTWQDLVNTSDGKIIKVVQSLPVTGETNVIYLLKIDDVSNGYDRYSSFVWFGASYGQISGYKIKWDEIVNKPDLLDCSVNLIDGSNYNLNLAYKQY